MSMGHPTQPQAVLALRREFDESFAQAPRLEREPLEGLLAVRLGGDPYAIRVSEIGGIHADRRIMPLPTPVPELLGVAGLRGQIAPVYDLAALLGYARASSPRWLILLRGASQQSCVALAFDTFERHFSVPLRHIVCASGARAAHPFSAQVHLADVVSTDDVVRPIIALPSLLQDIQGRADGVIQKRSVPP